MVSAVKSQAFFLLRAMRRIGARKKILAEWHKRKEDEITHPYTRDKMPLGMVPHIQARLLARRIRGDMEEYPPFVWK